MIGVMRQAMRRRMLLAAGAGAAAGGTLAVAWQLGKPSAWDAGATPVGRPPPRPSLMGIEALKHTNPPAPLPPADLIDANGEVHSVAGFAGQGLVINLWATWCVPCVAELPALAALAGQVSGDGILVLALSSDRGGTALVTEFYHRHGIAGLPVWLDPNGAAARAWGARGIPTTLIVDRSGRERGRIEGAVDWASDPSVSAIRRLVG